jgi:hypothetical protein
VNGLATLAGFLSFTARILLLLSWLLATALLLTGLLPWGLVLLPRGLVLLAGILVLIGHRDLPFSVAGDNCGTRHWLRGTSVPPDLFAAAPKSAVPADTPENYLCTSP